VLRPGCTGFLDTRRTLGDVVPRRTQKTKRDMFGRATQAATPPGPATPPPDRAGNREDPQFGGYPDFSGNRANFPLAGPPGRLQSLVADFWTAWWGRWAMVGILIVGLAVVLIIRAVT